MAGVKSLRAVIHAGLPKAASSSIQKTLAKNRKALRKKGFYYPLFRRGLKPITNHSVPFSSMYSQRPENSREHLLSGDSAKEAKRRVRSYHRQFEKALMQPYDLILSAEHLYFLQEHKLKSLREQIDKAQRDIKVIVLIRRPYSFLCSLAQQKVKMGMPTNFLLTAREISLQIDKLLRVFPDCSFYSFELACEHPYGVVGFFLEQLGFREEELERINFHTENVGLGNISTRFFADLNIEFPRLIKGQKNPLYIKAKALPIRDSKFLLTERELLRVKEHLDQENERLLKRLGEKFCDECYQTTEPLQLSLDDIEQIANLKALRSTHLTRAFRFCERYSPHSQRLWL